MKRLLLASVFTVALSVAAQAQIPVTDIATQLGLTKQTIEEVKNGITQLRSLQTDLQTLQWVTLLTTNLVHDPNLGTIMALANVMGLNTDLPVNLWAVQSLVSGYGGAGSFNGLVGKLGTLGNVLNTTYSNDNLYSCKVNSFGCVSSNTNMLGLTASKGMVSTMVGSMQDHLQVLTGLQTRLQTSGNLKDTADINAEIAAQHAWFTGQSAQISAVTAMSQMQTQISAEQRTQSWNRDLDAWNAEVK